MKVLILTADSNGGYPVPASRGGAVSALIEHLANGNNIKKLCDMQILSFYEREAFEKSKLYPNIDFMWVKVPFFIKFFDWCAFNFIRVVKKDEKAVSFKSAFSLLYYIRKAKKICNKSDADKIVLENNIPLARSLKKTKFKGQLYYHLHNIPRIDAGCRDVMEKTTAFLCVSQYVANRINAPDSAIGMISESKTRILYNCVDTSLFRPIAKQDKIICELKEKHGIGDNDRLLIFAGRLTEEKGADLLLQALAKLPKEYKAIIIGSYHYNADVKSEYQERLHSLAEKLGNRVIFTGYVEHDELPYYYNLADIAVLPSMWDEPAGLTNIEAMACGVPVITTDAGGIPEYVGDSVTLTRTDDIVDKIAESIINLSEKIKGSDIKDIHSREYIEKHFDKESYIDKFAAAISDD